MTSVETDSGGVAKQLDTDVGIDFIQTDKNHVCHTYATRVQIGKFWKTFTVRSVQNRQSIIRDSHPGT